MDPLLEEVMNPEEKESIMMISSLVLHIANID